MLDLSFLFTILNFTTFLAVAVLAPVCRQCYQHECDGNNNCLNGCIPGFAGGKCLNKCPRNCIASMCDYEGKTGTYPCSIGCIPGYHGLQCNTPCKDIEEGGKCDRYSGTLPDCGGRGYGENCETSCEPNCGGLVCDNKGKCFKEICIPGRYGEDCSKHCRAECERCHRDTGKCLQAYADNDTGNNLKCSCDNLGTEKEKDVTGYLLAITIMFVFIFCSWIFYYCEKYFWNTFRKRPGDDRNVSNIMKPESNTNPTDTGSEQHEKRLDEDPVFQSLLGPDEKKNSTALRSDQEKQRFDGDWGIPNVSKTPKKTNNLAAKRRNQQLRKRKSNSNPEMSTLLDKSVKSG